MASLLGQPQEEGNSPCRHDPGLGYGLEAQAMPMQARPHISGNVQARPTSRAYHLGLKPVTTTGGPVHHDCSKFLCYSCECFHSHQPFIQKKKQNKQANKKHNKTKQDACVDYLQPCVCCSQSTCSLNCMPVTFERVDWKWGPLDSHS